MGWDVIAGLIVSQGIPLAERIWQKWSTGTAPTQADFDELKAMASQRGVDRAKAALARRNIPLESEQGKALLALIGEI